MREACRVEHLTYLGGDLTLEWESPRIARLSASDLSFETAREWRGFYRRVDRAIAAVHESIPLFAIVFVDWGGMAMAPESAIARFVALERMSLRQRGRAVVELLASNDEAETYVALQFVTAALGTRELRTLERRSEADRSVVQRAVVEELRFLARGYDRRLVAFDRALKLLPCALISGGVAYAIGMAAARDAPRVGAVLACVQSKHPARFRRIMTELSDPKPRCAGSRPSAQPCVGEEELAGTLAKRLRAEDGEWAARISCWLPR